MFSSLSCKVLVAQIKRSKLNVYITTTNAKVKFPGLVVGSIAIVKSKHVYNRYGISFSKQIKVKEKKDKTIVEIVPEETFKIKLLPDFWENDTAVYLFAYKRDEGTYILDNAYFFEIGAGYVVTKNAGQIHNYNLPINTTFQVEEGMVSYIGKIVINANDNNATVLDKSATDIVLIAERFKDEKWDFSKFINNVSPSPTNTPSPPIPHK